MAGKRCYVGNLAWKTSWQDLKDLFRSVGTVVYSNVMVLAPHTLHPTALCRTCLWQRPLTLC